MDMFLMFKGQKEVEKTVNLKQEKDGNRKKMETGKRWKQEKDGNRKNNELL